VAVCGIIRSPGAARWRPGDHHGEFALATDIRFASLERAVLGQMEAGFAAVAGGGAGGRLPARVGRGRAFEILLGGEDYDGALAEKYGYVNRAIPDSEFEDFVTAYATRVSGWDHQAIAEIKGFINKYTRLPDEEFPLHSDAFWGAAGRPEFRSVAARLFDKGLQERGALECNLGKDIAAIAQSA
jgi:enoyl-CoA hydratase/carnithine racemase